jgi:hypothetical protein
VVTWQDPIMQLAHVHDVSAHAVAAAQQQTTLDGQVTYRRRLSSKLVGFSRSHSSCSDRLNYGKHMPMMAQATACRLAALKCSRVTQSAAADVLTADAAGVL